MFFSQFVLLCLTLLKGYNILFDLSIPLFDFIFIDEKNGVDYGKEKYFFYGTNKKVNA